MPVISGYFDPPRPKSVAHARGMVDGIVTVPPRGSFSATFQIDTGSAFTVLADRDFLAAIQLLGCPHSLGGLGVLSWIAAEGRQTLEPMPALARTLGGSCDLYLIRRACILLCDKTGRTLEQRLYVSPVHGLFTSAFLEQDPDCRLLPSVLGRNALNRLQRLEWSRPRGVIELTT